MNWYIGQDIVAIASHSGGRFKEGDIFVIDGLMPAHCNCSHILINIGQVWHGNASCPDCESIYNSNDGVAWYNEVCFAPLDAIADISELTEVLNEPAFQV